jgi:neutral ceramidase
MGELLAGAARVKLDPPLGLAMAGYGNRVGRATGVHDDLAAQALVLSDGAGKVAIAGVDVLALGQRIADDVRERVAAKSDIAADAIMVCATHTHSGPAFNIFATPRPDAKPADGRSIEWECTLPGKIASAIIRANERLEPASLRAADARFTLGTNRRLMRPGGQIQLAANYRGVADGEAEVLGVFNRSSAPIAFVFNYPCHGVVLCEDNLLYTRDWPGFAMDELERAACSSGGKPAISIFLQGATGNIDPRSRGSFAVAEDSGRAMGHAAFEAISHAASLTDARIVARRLPLKLKLKPLDVALASARDSAAQTEASLNNHRGGDGYQLKRLRDHHAQSLSALAALEWLEEQNRRDRRVDMARRELSTSLTIVTIGNLALVGVPGELFVELGLALKNNPHFVHIFVVGYCNDLIGYIPTRAAYDEGGYEVDTARIAAGSGEAIVAAALSTLEEMRTSASNPKN